MYVCDFYHSLYQHIHFSTIYSFTFFQMNIHMYLYRCAHSFLFCETFRRSSSSFIFCFCRVCEVRIRQTPIFYLLISVDYFTFMCVYVICIFSAYKPSALNEIKRINRRVTYIFIGFLFFSSPCSNINFSFIFYTSSDQIPNQLLIYFFSALVLFLQYIQTNFFFLM